jgi:hypothetical protein
MRITMEGGVRGDVTTKGEEQMFGRTIKRVVAGTALSAGLVVGSGVGAWAHECFNASRSDQGNAMAGERSQAWFTLRIADAIASDVEAGWYSAEDGACILDAYTATGAPLSFTLHVKGAIGQDGVIGMHNRNDELHVDGKGIDHLFDAYGWAIFTSFEDCGVSFPM